MILKMQAIKLAAIFAFILVCSADDYGYAYDDYKGDWDGDNDEGDDDDDHDDGYVVAEYYRYPAYSFEYGVKDDKTGDYKSHWESRDGDKVKGVYMLHEPDGTIRVVEYYANKHDGFNAIVKKIGHAHHPQYYNSRSDGDDRGYGYGYQYDNGYDYEGRDETSNLDNY